MAERIKRLSHGLLANVLASVLAVIACGAVAGTDVPYATPPGITLIDMERRRGYYTALHLWTHLGDAEGRSLFISDNDSPGSAPRCTGACEQDFPPIIAAPGATPSGDWSVVKREDGREQWAYQGKPLYRFARETRLNEVADNLLAMSTKRKLLGRVLDSGKLQPPEGWHLAKFEPAAQRQLPGVIVVKTILAAGAVALVDENHMTLYAFDGKPEQAVFNSACDGSWRALSAAELSHPVGDFAPVARADGSRQWSYKGKLLFGYQGDLQPGDIKGLDCAAKTSDSRWQVAALAHHFMPAGVKVRKDIFSGEILATSKGMPLYRRSSHDNFYKQRYIYTKGKKVGTSGCDAECLKVWAPLRASDSDQASGYWEVVTRPDGSRQWAFKGSAIYTYSKDKADGTATGDNRYDLSVGDRGRYPVAEITASTINEVAPPAFFWKVITP